MAGANFHLWYKICYIFDAMGSFRAGLVKVKSNEDDVLTLQINLINMLQNGGLCHVSMHIVNDREARVYGQRCNDA